MNPIALIDELKNDPLNLGYNEKTWDEVWTILNTKNRPGRNIPITNRELLAWSAANRRYLNIKNASLLHPSDDIKSLCFAALSLFTLTGAEIDLSLPDRAALINALVAGSVISIDDRTSLLALGIGPSRSRLEELGCDDIGEQLAKHYFDYESKGLVEERP